MEQEYTVRFNFALTPAQDEWIRRQAFDAKVSKAVVVRDLIDRARTRDYWSPRIAADAAAKRDIIEVLQSEIAEIERVQALVRERACAKDMADPVVGLEGDYGVLDEALSAARRERRQRIQVLEREIRALEGAADTPWGDLLGASDITPGSTRL